MFSLKNGKKKKKKKTKGESVVYPFFFYRYFGFTPNVINIVSVCLLERNILIPTYFSIPFWTISELPLYIYICIINKKMLLLVTILKPNFKNVISSFNECNILF